MARRVAKLATKPKRLPTLAALAATATRERKQRAADALKLEAHRQAVERSEQATRTGRIVGVVKERKRPFDPKAGRYRMARGIPGAAQAYLGRYAVMPTDAPSECPKCGASQPAYRQRGRYVCPINRLVTKNYGCGHRWVGTRNPSESPLTSSESTEWTDPVCGPPVPPDALYDDLLGDVVFT